MSEVRTAWGAFLHPSRASRELAELRGRCAEQESELERACGGLEAAERRCGELEAALADMSGRRDSLDGCVRSLTAELQDTKRGLQQRDREYEALLGEHRDLERDYDEMERGIADIEKRMDAVQEMKDGYERRIARLRARIKELKNTPGPIDMANAMPAPDDDPDSDWLRPLD